MNTFTNVEDLKQYHVHNGESLENAKLLSQHLIFNISKIGQKPKIPDSYLDIVPSQIRKSFEKGDRTADCPFLSILKLIDEQKLPEQFSDKEKLKNKLQKRFAYNFDLQLKAILKDKITSEERFQSIKSVCVSLNAKIYNIYRSLDLAFKFSNDSSRCIFEYLFNSKDAIGSYWDAINGFIETKDWTSNNYNDGLTRAPRRSKIEIKEINETKKSINRVFDDAKDYFTRTHNSNCSQFERLENNAFMLIEPLYLKLKNKCSTQQQLKMEISSILSCDIDKSDFLKLEDDNLLTLSFDYNKAENPGYLAKEKIKKVNFNILSDQGTDQVKDLDISDCSLALQNFHRKIFPTFEGDDGLSWLVSEIKNSTKHYYSLSLSRLQQMIDYRIQVLRDAGIVSIIDQIKIDDSLSPEEVVGAQYSNLWIMDEKILASEIMNIPPEFKHSILNYITIADRGDNLDEFKYFKEGGLHYILRTDKKIDRKDTLLSSSRLSVSSSFDIINFQKCQNPDNSDIQEIYKKLFKTNIFRQYASFIILNHPDLEPYESFEKLYSILGHVEGVMHSSPKHEVEVIPELKRISDLINLYLEAI